MTEKNEMKEEKNGQKEAEGEKKKTDWAALLEVAREKDTTTMEKSGPGKEWRMREGKGKTRSGASEKKGKGPGPGSRMVPNMGAGGSHSQTMQRVPEEEEEETEEEERKEEKKEEDGQDGEREATSSAGRVLEATEERREMEKAEAAKEVAMTEQRLVVERMGTAKEAETEFEAEVLEHSLKEKRDEQWKSVRQHELLSEGRRVAEKLGEKMAEELKTAARKGGNQPGGG